METKAEYELIPYSTRHHSLLAAQLGRTVFGRPGDKDLYETGGPGFTLLYQGRVIGSAGVIILWSGVGDAWAYLGPEARSHLRAVQFYTRRGLGMICQEYKLRRVQALVIKDFESARRWAESLGFRVEGEMPLAGPNGETLVRYALFPQGV